MRDAKAGLEGQATCAQLKGLATHVARAAWKLERIGRARISDRRARGTGGHAARAHEYM